MKINTLIIEYRNGLEINFTNNLTKENRIH